jgi:hypothetical protein
MPCTEIITLPPTTDLPASFTVPAAARPYIQQWFQETKNPGETPDAFLLRKLVEVSLNYIHQKLADQCSTSQSQISRDYNDALRTEKEGLLQTLLP